MYCGRLTGSCSASPMNLRSGEILWSFSTVTVEIFGIVLFAEAWLTIDLIEHFPISGLVAMVRGMPFAVLVGKATLGVPTKKAGPDSCDSRMLERIAQSGVLLVGPVNCISSLGYSTGLVARSIQAGNVL